MNASYLDLANKLRLCEVTCENLKEFSSAEKCKRMAEEMMSKALLAPADGGMNTSEDGVRYKKYTLTLTEQALYADPTGTVKSSAYVLILRQDIRDRFLARRSEDMQTGYDGVDVYSSDGIQLLFRVL